MWCVPSRYEYDVDVVRTSEGWQKMKGGNDPACGLNVMRFMVDSLACSALFMFSFVKSTFDPFFRRPPGGGVLRGSSLIDDGCIRRSEVRQREAPNCEGSAKDKQQQLFNWYTIELRCHPRICVKHSVVSKQSHEITSSSSRVFHLSISICILHKQSALRMTTITNCRK